MTLLQKRFSCRLSAQSWSPQICCLSGTTFHTHLVTVAATFFSTSFFRPGRYETTYSVLAEICPSLIRNRSRTGFAHIFNSILPFFSCEYYCPCHIASYYRRVRSRTQYLAQKYLVVTKLSCHKTPLTFETTSSFPSPSLPPFN